MFANVFQTLFSQPMLINCKDLGGYKQDNEQVSIAFLNMP